MIADWPPYQTLFSIVQVARPGYFGVDLFFVLSGFLITRILCSELKQSGSIDFRTFYIKRALRILPIYYICVVFCLLYFHSSWLDLLATATYTANLGYMPIDPRPMEHTWSLAVEEQFYLVWPVLLAFVSYQRGRWLSRYVLPIAAVASACLIAWLKPNAEGALLIYLLPCTRMLSLSLGASLAFYEADGMVVRTGTGVVLCVAGFAIAALAVMGRAHGLVPPGAPYWVLNLVSSALVGLGLVAAAISSGQSSVLTQLLCLRPLRYIGRISYGLYLYHYVVLFAFNINEAKVRTTGASGLLTAEALLVTVVIAALSYHFIELPIMKLKTRLISGDGRVALHVGRHQGDADDKATATP